MVGGPGVSGPDPAAVLPQPEPDTVSAMKPPNQPPLRFESDTYPSRPPRRDPARVAIIGVAVAAALAVALLVILLVTGEDMPVAESSSLVPSATAETPVATASPSAVPTPSPTPPLPHDAVAQVVTTDLVVRSAPGTGDDSEIYPGALDAPVLLFVVDGPVAASGYDWYLVQPFTLAKPAPLWPAMPFGWVAAEGRDGEDWIALADLECPRPTFQSVADLSSAARLACYGDAPITIEADLRGQDAVIPGVTSPHWLLDAGYMLVPSGTFEPDKSDLPYLFVHITDDVPGQGGMLDLPPGSPVRVEGHFDDPAAQTCVRGGLLPGEDPASTPEPLTPESVVLQCRWQFVVTVVTLISP